MHTSQPWRTLEQLALALPDASDGVDGRVSDVVLSGAQRHLEGVGKRQLLADDVDARPAVVQQGVERGSVAFQTVGERRNVVVVVPVQGTQDADALLTRLAVEPAGAQHQSVKHSGFTDVFQNVGGYSARFVTRIRYAGSLFLSLRPKSKLRQKVRFQT